MVGKNMTIENVNASALPSEIDNSLAIYSWALNTIFFMKMLFLDCHKNSPCVCACAYKSGGGAKVFIYWRFAHLFRSRAVTHLNHRGMFIHKANELRTERHTSRWIKPPHSDRPNQSVCVGGMAEIFNTHVYW